MIQFGKSVLITRKQVTEVFQKLRRALGAQPQCLVLVTPSLESKAARDIGIDEPQRIGKPERLEAPELRAFAEREHPGPHVSALIERQHKRAIKVRWIKAARSVAEMMLECFDRPFGIEQALQDRESP